MALLYLDPSSHPSPHLFNFAAFYIPHPLLLKPPQLFGTKEYLKTEQTFSNPGQNIYNKVMISSKIQLKLKRTRKL